MLHFACHGRFEADAPLESRIELAPSDGEDDEQPDLTVEAVLGMNLKATLVTLSACESGLSRIHPGEEPIRLTRSFLDAETPALLVSLCSVHDESTGALMELFYQALLGPSPGGVGSTTPSTERRSCSWVTGSRNTPTTLQPGTLGDASCGLRPVTPIVTLPSWPDVRIMRPRLPSLRDNGVARTVPGDEPVRRRRSDDDFELARIGHGLRGGRPSRR